MFGEKSKFSKYNYSEGQSKTFACICSIMKCWQLIYQLQVHCLRCSCVAHVVRANLYCLLNG